MNRQTSKTSEVEIFVNRQTSKTNISLISSREVFVRTETKVVGCQRRFWTHANIATGMDKMMVQTRGPIELHRHLIFATIIRSNLRFLKRLKRSFLSPLHVS